MRVYGKLVVAAGLAASALAWAGPAEDFKAGQDAYNRGDVRAAISVLRKAADAGHAPSQVLLGDILDLSEQNEEAVKYYRLAAAQGDAGGYYGLGTLHAAGEGVPRDPKAAREWITKAAEAGHRRAIQTLALAYMRGGLGLAEAERATPVALQWIEKAAAHDSLDAIDRLALAHKQGHYGITPDLQKAQEYEARARALRGIVPAKPRKGTKASG